MLSSALFEGGCRLLTGLFVEAVNFPGDDEPVSVIVLARHDGVAVFCGCMQPAHHLSCSSALLLAAKLEGRRADFIFVFALEIWKLGSNLFARGCGMAFYPAYSDFHLGAQAPLSSRATRLPLKSWRRRTNTDADPHFSPAAWRLPDNFPVTEYNRQMQGKSIFCFADCCLSRQIRAVDGNRYIPCTSGELTAPVDNAVRHHAHL